MYLSIDFYNSLIRDQSVYFTNNINLKYYTPDKGGVKQSYLFLYLFLDANQWVEH